MLSPEAFADVLFRQLQAKFIVAGNDYRFGYNRLGDCDFWRQRDKLSKLRCFAFLPLLSMAKGYRVPPYVQR